MFFVEIQTHSHFWLKIEIVMTSAFIIKSARIDALSIVLKNGDTEVIATQLNASFSDFANLQNMPFLLDVHLLPDPYNLDLEAVLRCFAASQIRIVGVRHVDKNYAPYVAASGLAFILMSKEKETADIPKPAVAAPNPQPTQVQLQQSQHKIEKLQSELQQARGQVLQLQQQVQEWQQQVRSTEKTVRQQSQQELRALQMQLQQAGNEQAQRQIAQLQQQVQTLQQQLQQAQEKHAEQPQPKQPVQCSLPTSTPTIIVDKPVRSGQQIYAEGGDVICTALVSQGAEIIADGNIHIYAPFRGRALAGASGDKNARIFIHSMQGQLISIAGIYRVFDKELPVSLNGKAVVVSLDGDKLNITALGGS
ncbi:MAG: septum site-determining protein MinC [Neisseriaceae bacterium]|nr:septum site-determining protein MinC [Neisseriaceae bacterium]